LEYTIFISRTLKDRSPFFSSFGEPINIKAYSLLEFSPVSFVQPKEVDLIFFYSSNAVRFFFSQLEEAPSSSEFCCMGTGTAATLMALGHEPYFVGKENPSTIAKDFLKLSKSKKVLFPRAKYSKKSVQNIIQNEVEVLDIVVYENSKKTVFPDPKADMLIFTSPLNAEAYFDCIPYRGEYLLAIGRTTLNYLESLGFEDVMISDASTEGDLADAAKAIIFGLQ
jgi:uroporphyrinogen-III synthase